MDLAAVEAKGDEKLELEKSIYTVISSSYIATYSDSTRADTQISEELIKFKADPIRAQVDDISCFLDAEILCDILDENLSLLNFSAAVGSNVDKPHFTDCAIFHAS